MTLAGATPLSFIRRSAALVALLVVAFAAGALITPSRALATATWQAGAAQESTITDCVSQINGNPMSSPGAAVTPYVYEDYNNPPPAQTVYYLAVQVYGIGDDCGGQAADIAVTLPPNTSPAISLTTPVRCYPLQPNSSNTQVVAGPEDTSGACPQNPSPVAGQSNTYRFDMAQNSGFDATSFYPFWAIPMGYGVEIHIPVVTSSAITDHATAMVKMIDGFSDPTLTPTVNVIVGAPTSNPSAGPPSVANPQVTSITNNSAYLSATFVYNYSNTVTPNICWGTSSSTPYCLGYSADFATPPYEVSFGSTLSGLQPGCTYHWRGTMVDNTAHTVANTGDLTFTTTGSGGNCSAAISSSNGSSGTPYVYRRPPLVPSSQPMSGLRPPPPEPKPNPKPPTTTTTTTNTPSPHPPAFTNLLLHTVQHGTSLVLQLVIGVSHSGLEIDALIPGKRHGRRTSRTILVGKLIRGSVGAGRLKLKLALNGTGKRLLRQHHVLHLQLRIIVTPPGQKPVVVIKNVTLRR